MMLKTAGKSMRTLIGDEGMKKAASVKTDAKAAKKAGMESPEERQRRINKERQKEEKMQKAPPKKVAKSDDVGLGGFDLDSVLASTSSGPSASAPTGRKSSVVVTEAAEEMDRMNAQQEAPTSSLPASMTRQRRSAPPTSAQTQAAPEQETKKPQVRRRKAVKKAKPAEETPAPAPKETYEEDEDFSDFSF